MTNLVLDHNQISNIDGNAFNGLNSLLELKLDNNQIDSVNKELLEQKLRISIPQCKISF